MLAFAACDGEPAVPSDDGDIELVLTLPVPDDEGRTERTLAHAPPDTVLQVAPPDTGELTVLLEDDDGLALAFTIDATIVEEGDEIALPVASPFVPDDCHLEIEIDGAVSASDDDAAAGTLVFERLAIDEDRGAYDVYVVVDVTLGAIDAQLGARGHIATWRGEVED